MTNMTDATTAYVRLTHRVSLVTNIVLAVAVLVALGFIGVAWSALAESDTTLRQGSADSSVAQVVKIDAKAALTAAAAAKDAAWSKYKSNSRAEAIRYDSETAAGVANGTIAVPPGGSFGFDAGLYASSQTRDAELAKPYAAAVNALEAAQEAVGDAELAATTTALIESATAVQREAALTSLTWTAVVAAAAVLLIGLLALAFAVSAAKARASLTVRADLDSV